MPKIEIHRKRDWLLRLGYTTVYEIFMNDQKIGYLKNGETKIFIVTQGEHKLRIKSGWFGSREHRFNVFRNDNKTFTVFSSQNYLIIVFVLLILLLLYLPEALNIYLSKKTGDHIIFASAVFYFVFQIFGRKSYIIIRENNDD